VVVADISLERKEIEASAITNLIFPCRLFPDDEDVLNFFVFCRRCYCGGSLSLLRARALLKFDRRVPLRWKNGMNEEKKSKTMFFEGFGLNK